MGSAGQLGVIDLLLMIAFGMVGSGVRPTVAAPVFYLPSAFPGFRLWLIRPPPIGSDLVRWCATTPWVPGQMDPTEVSRMCLHHSVDECILHSLNECILQPCGQAPAPDYLPLWLPCP